MRWFAVVVAALAVASGITYRYWDPGSSFEIRGVDVSHHQGPIDWRALAADGTHFAYVKATEGGDWRDTRFHENWAAAHEAGVLRGAYHFFTLCSPGAAQAANMIATVPDEPGMLPPAVDLEFGGNCSARPSTGDFLTELDQFLTAIEDHYRMRPVVYTNAVFYNAYLAEVPPDVTWWIASPVRPPWGAPRWSIWQYFPGHRPGVDGRVDRNVFRGSIEDLRALTARPSN